MYLLRSLVLIMTTFLVNSAFAATYFIDYDAGLDSQAGTSADAAWKHCPSDVQARETAKSCVLQAGDRIIFKGSVRYRGSIVVKWSGKKDAPITYDGNVDGTFGKGSAIIDGSQLISAWKPCANQDDAEGNEHWEKIYFADIAHAGNWRAFNLSSNKRPLPVAQSPNPKDPMFQDRIAEFFEAKDKLHSSANVSVYSGPGTWLNKQRPLANIVTPAAGSAVVTPVGEASIHVATNVEHTVDTFGIQMLPQHTQVKDVWLYADKKLIKKVQLKRGESAMQKFKLDKAVTASDFAFKLASGYEAKPKNTFTAVKRVGAWNAAGENILEEKPSDGEGMTFSDPERLTATAADYYNGMTMAVHGGHNFTFHLNVLGFDPQTHSLKVSSLKDTIYKTTKYSLLNSVKLIDVQGEYALKAHGNGKARVYVYPDDLENSLPFGVSYAVRERAFDVKGQSHIIIDSFVVERQSGIKTSPVDILESSFITVQNVEVSKASGIAAIHVLQSSDVVLRACNLHHLPVKTRGLRFSESKRCDAIGCAIVKPTGTALVYVDTKGGRCAGNTVSEYHGMHSNGMTFYVKCTDLVIENNHVFKGSGNVALTIQDAINVVIRNNVIDADGGMGVGLWVATPFKNIHIVHNTIINSNSSSTWQTAIFSNNKKPEQMVIKNNILDGIAGTLPAEYGNNIYLRLNDKQRQGKLEAGSQHVSDADSVLYTSGPKKFQLKAGSPAINAAADIGVLQDYAEHVRTVPDIGAVEFIK